MNLSKWNNFLVEQENSTGNDPGLQTTNTSARQEMLADSENDITVIPRGMTAENHILEGMGYEIGRDLGSGVFGDVVEITDKETGNKFAAKLLIGGTSESTVREIRNYKFVLANRDKLGNNKKYLPKVYYSEIITFKNSPTSMNPYPPSHQMGLVIMELLAPLPDRVYHDLIATGGAETGDARNRFASRKAIDFSTRDKRLFKNHAAILDILGNAIKHSQLLQNLVSTQFNSIANRVSHKATSRFLKGGPQDLSPELNNLLHMAAGNNWRTKIKNRQAQQMFVILLDEFHKHMFPEGGTPVVQYMNDYLVSSIMGQIYEGFLQNYFRPIIPGSMSQDNNTTIMKPQHHSSVEQFPEASGFIQFLNDMKGIGVTARDMHKGNFLMRPSDNEIVVVDLGLFQIESGIQVADRGETVPFFERKRR